MSRRTQFESVFRRRMVLGSAKLLNFFFDDRNIRESISCNMKF